MRKINGYAMIIGLGLVIGGCSAFQSASTSTTTSGITTDSAIQTNLGAKLNNSDNFPGSNLYVDAFQGTVLLTGQVADKDQKTFMLNVVRGYPGVTKIYDYTEIRLPTSLSVRSADSMVTTSVKAQLLGTNGIPSNNIKVETTNGVVYMMGNLTREQAESAAQMTALVGGVEKVVTLFNYVQP